LGEGKQKMGPKDDTHERVKQRGLQWSETDTRSHPWKRRWVPLSLGEHRRLEVRKAKVLEPEKKEKRKTKMQKKTFNPKKTKRKNKKKTGGTPKSARARETIQKTRLENQSN